MAGADRHRYAPGNIGALEVNWRDHIHCDDTILAGKPVVRGTRLAVDFVLGLFASGWTEEQVLQNYPNLSRDAIRAVFAFAAESLADETLYPTGRKLG